MRGGADKSTVSRYLVVGEAFPPEVVARAGVPEEEMASLSLPILLRAARKPEGQRFTLLRDVLRKRRARVAGKSAGIVEAGTTPTDADPTSQEPGPSSADRGADGPKSTEEGWQRYYRERGIRVETMAPVREMTAEQARAASLRIVPALAALSARTLGREHPAPLALEGDGGTVIFLPAVLDTAEAAAYERFREAISL